MTSLDYQMHNYFPNKHTRFLSRMKYTYIKINDGTQEDWNLR